jgi:hypothetical protein
MRQGEQIDDPNGIGSTVGNGTNNAGDLVGFYTKAPGDTDGMLAVLPLTPAPYKTWGSGPGHGPVQQLARTPAQTQPSRSLR